MSERVEELFGSQIKDVRIDGDLAYLFVTHRGTDDEACTLLVRIPEIEWLHPRPVSNQEHPPAIKPPDTRTPEQVKFDEEMEAADNAYWPDADGNYELSPEQSPAISPKEEA